jgi:hypothetical protein
MEDNVKKLVVARDEAEVGGGIQRVRKPGVGARRLWCKNVRGAVHGLAGDLTDAETAVGLGRVRAMKGRVSCSASLRGLRRDAVEEVPKKILGWWPWKI